MTTNHNHTCHPLGASDAAKRYGVVLKTVQQWRYRDAHGRHRAEPMPDPDWEVSGRPAWCAHTLDPWAQRTGRWQPATPTRRGALATPTPQTEPA